MNLTDVRNMSKRDFMIMYVLNRAVAKTKNMDGQVVAEMAELAWDVIQKCSKEE